MKNILTITGILVSLSLPAGAAIVSGGSSSGLTGVTAGTNLTGGGTSGTVTVNLSATLSGITTLAVSTLTATNIVGTTTNDNSTALSVGEYISGLVALNNVTGASGTSSSISTITLTAGDWDVSAMGFLNNNSASITNFEMTINTTANTDGTLGDNATRVAEAATTTNETSLAIPLVRISVASSTPVYLVIDVTYTVATPRFAGFIRARRRR